MKWIISDAMGVIYTAGDDINGWLIPFLKTRNNNIDSRLVQELYIKTSAGEYSSKEFWTMLGFGSEYPGIEQYYLDTYPELDTSCYYFFNAVDTSVYKIAMLSNDVSEWSAWLRKRFNIQHYFSDCIISGDVKVRKPEPEIFNITLNRLQAQPADCIFIDDRLKNLHTAADLGFHTVFFDRNQIDRKAATNLPHVHAYVTSFTELMPVIKTTFTQNA
jgi:putative hydrolase of the HAD superfamily